MTLFIFIRIYFWILMANLAPHFRSKNMLDMAVIGLRSAVIDLRDKFPNHDFSDLIYTVRELEIVSKDLK